MSFPRYSGYENELYDYTEEELEFIFGGNLNNKRPAHEGQKEAVLAAFEQAKEECLLRQNKASLEKPKALGNESKIAVDQLNYSTPTPTSTISPTPTLNPIIENYLNHPTEKKHRHCNSFFNKFRSKHDPRELPIGASITRVPRLPIIHDTLSVPQPQFLNYSQPGITTLPYQFNEEKYFDYELKLIAADNDREAREVVKEMLAREGCLWDGKQNDYGFNQISNSNLAAINAFNNVFLCSLRHNTIEGYRQIIEEQYLQKLTPPVQFQTGAINLYRGDTRSYEHIFKNGFDLWPGYNTEATPKIMYSSDHGRVGISTSKATATPLSFVGSFFRIHLPSNHRLLAIPFANTYQEEVNFMDNIPPEYIRSFVERSGAERENPKYSPDVILSPKVRRGCY